jgi:molybdopterin-guanine dinucleotide biosynthesis protein B
MRMMGFAGWSGAGKTTLLSRLIPNLIARGLRVSTIKHAHHRFDIDLVGKDSWRHREAGASEVLVSSSRRVALMRELREQAEPSLEELLAMLSPVDLVLIEGFKSNPHPKIEVHRRAQDQPYLWPTDPSIIALATDLPIGEVGVPVLDIDDIDAIAEATIAGAVAFS